MGYEARAKAKLASELATLAEQAEWMRAQRAPKAAAPKSAVPSAPPPVEGLVVEGPATGVKGALLRLLGRGE